VILININYYGGIKWQHTVSTTHNTQKANNDMQRKTFSQCSIRTTRRKICRKKCCKNGERKDSQACRQSRKSDKNVSKTCFYVVWAAEAKIARMKLQWQQTAGHCKISCTASWQTQRFNNKPNK